METTEKLKKIKTNMITPAELQKRLESNEDFVVLDARNPVDAAKIWVESDKRIAIALNDLPERYTEIPQGKKMVIHIITGVHMMA